MGIFVYSLFGLDSRFGVLPVWVYGTCEEVSVVRGGVHDRVEVGRAFVTVGPIYFIYLH